MAVSKRRHCFSTRNHQQQQQQQEHMAAVTTTTTPIRKLPTASTVNKHVLLAVIIVRPVVYVFCNMIIIVFG
jgi:hypothetical protein